MSEAGTVHEGGCRCGRVRFRVSAAPLLTMACHCTGCQRMSASTFSLSAAIPAEGFAVTRGEPVIGGLRGEHRHYHCTHCKSWLFTRAAGLDHFVNIRSTMLDARAYTSPFVETWTSEKLPWASTPARHSFERFPAFEDYAALTKAFAEQARETP